MSRGGLEVDGEAIERQRGLARLAVGLRATQPMQFNPGLVADEGVGLDIEKPLGRHDRDEVGIGRGPDVAGHTDPLGLATDPQHEGLGAVLRGLFQFANAIELDPGVVQAVGRSVRHRLGRFFERVDPKGED